MKSKTWFSALATGQILLMANIIQNIAIEHEATLEWLKYAGLFFILPIIVLWPLPVFTLRKFGKISPNGSFLATTQLVEKGIYKLIRHPQYLSFMLLNIGIALINQNSITILISAVSVGFLFAGIKEEEQLMIKQFDNDYSAYIKRVPSINIFRGLYRLYKR
jgi:protein-S-isoprenylcysteine O-methyltransferase Ste14